MKTIDITIIICLALFTTNNSYSQVYLRTQAQVNSMAGINPWGGWVYIEELDNTPESDWIVDLSPLYNLDSAGTIRIMNTHLETLSGIDNLKSIIHLEITDNNYLKNIDALNSLELVNTLWIKRNNALDSIHCFEALRSGEVTIQDNDTLSYLFLDMFLGSETGDSASFIVRNHSNLKFAKIINRQGSKNRYSLVQCPSLQTFYYDGDSASFINVGTTSEIYQNFTSVFGFANTHKISTLGINGCENLNNFCQLVIPVQNGVLFIDDLKGFNNPIFSSLQDPLTLDCSNYTSIEEATIKGFRLYPNPVVSGEAVQLDALFTGTVFNSIGQPVLQLKNEQSFSTASLAAGLYVLRSITGETSKLVVQ